MTLTDFDSFSLSRVRLFFSHLRLFLDVYRYVVKYSKKQNISQQSGGEASFEKKKKKLGPPLRNKEDNITKKK